VFEWESADIWIMATPVKDHHFELLTEIQKPDAKKRLSLGAAVGEDASAYNIYRNRLGQIVLDPVTAVPTYEALLFNNKKALASVKRGLSDSAAGHAKKAGEVNVRERGRLIAKAAPLKAFFAKPRYTRAFLARRKNLRGGVDLTKLISEERDREIV
jgi:hypothetical protein